MVLRVHDRHGFGALEQLEPRLVLATIGGVSADQEGFVGRFDGNYESADDSLNLSGAGASVEEGFDPTSFQGSVIFGENGSFELVWAAGPDNPGSEQTSQTGAQFLKDDFGAGWVTAKYQGASFSEVAFVVETSPQTAMSDLEGAWKFSHAWGTKESTESTTSTGTGSITDGMLVLNLGGHDHHRYQLEQIGTSGKFFVRDESVVWYLNHDSSVLLGVDYDYSPNVPGDELGLFIGVRADTQATLSSAAGDYRLYTHGESEAPLDETEALLRLGVDGSFITYDLDQFDDGSQNELKSGTWTVNSEGLITLNAGGEQMTLYMASNRKNLLPTSTTFSGGGFSGGKQIGLGTRVSGAGVTPVPADGFIGHLDATGHPFVHENRGGDWVAIDLMQAEGDVPTTAVAIDVETWVDTHDNITRAAVAHAEGMFIFTRDDFGLWTGVKNPGASGGTIITSQLTLFQSLEGRRQLFEGSFVAGVTGSGDLVYFNLSIAENGGARAWSFLNVTDQLIANDVSNIPVFDGELVSFVSAWNGVNIAGLDASGAIQSVWWAAGTNESHWLSNDLSLIRGLEPLAGGLSVYIATWKSQHIVGVNGSGHLVGVWWHPSLGGDWPRIDLTDFIGGAPTLQQVSVTSFVFRVTGEPIKGEMFTAGLTEDGDLVAYWWSKQRESDGASFSGWVVTEPGELGFFTLSQRPMRDLRSQVIPTPSTLNIYGTTDDGGLIRTSRLGDGDAWTVERVS